MSLSVRRWNAIGRALRVIFGAVLLTTCSTDSALAPRWTAQSTVDAAAFFRAGGEFPIPVDEVILDVRRVSDNSVVFSDTLTAQQFTQSGGQLLISINLDLKSTTEQFSFTAIVRGGGVEYYRTTGTVTATAGQSTQTTPLTPVYTGPGSTADSVSIPAATALTNGQTATLTATVWQGTSPMTGVPVSFQSSDSSQLIPQSISLSQASITAPATGSGSVIITAKTPGGQSTTGTVSWSQAASTIVKISGDNQSIPVGTAGSLPLIVEVHDGLGNPVAGVAVTFAVVSGPTGTSVAPTATTTDNFGRAQTTLTAGATAGAIGVTASATGLTGSPITFSATATTGTGPAASVAANSPTTQNATVNTAVASPPSVLVLDAASQPVANVAVTFAIASGGGSLTGGTQSTNASGVATVSSWTVGQTAGANTMTATVATLPPVTFTATGTAGPAASVAIVTGNGQTGPANALLAQPLVVVVKDAFSNPITGATVNWATPDGGSLAPPSGPTGVTGQAQSNWTLGPTAPSQTATATVGALPAATFTATATFGPPAISLAFVGIPDVGVGKSVAVQATLSAPAPAGGTPVTLASALSTVAQVQAPVTVTIPQGGSTANFTVNGLVIGSTTLTASAPGYTSGTLPITVQDRSISVTATLNVPFGGTAQLPINIGSPAPVGGVVISVSSDNPSAVGVQTPSVTIPAGATSANAVLQGLLPGTANVTVDNPAYTTDVSVVTTSAKLNVLQSSTTLNASFPIDIDIQLTSLGVGIAAPPGGIAVTAVPNIPSCVTSNSPRTIPAGQVATTMTLSAGTGPFPCNTPVIVNATNIQPDTVQVTVNPVPGFSLAATQTLGSGLQITTGVSMGASNHGGITVHVVSTDSSKVLIAPNLSSAGTGSIDIPVPVNGGSFSYVSQAIDGQTGLIPIDITAPGFTPASINDSVVTPAADIIFLNSTATVFQANNVFQIRTGYSSFNAQGVPTGIAQEQARRFGGPALTATVVNDTAAVAVLVGLSTSGNSLPVAIQPGQSRSPSGASQGGVEFKPLNPGVTTVSATIPGFLSVPQTPPPLPQHVVTVSAPGISMSGVSNVGSGLQVGGSGNLATPNHGGVTVHLVLTDSTIFRITTNPAVTGSGSLDIPILNGNTGFSYTVQAIEGQTGTAFVRATAPGFSADSTLVTAIAPAFDIIFLNTTTTSLAPNNAFQIRTGIPNGQLTGIQQEQVLRGGSPGATVTVDHATSAVAKLVTSAFPAGADTVTVQLAQQQSRTPSPASAGGVEYDPVAPGSDTVHAKIPGFITLPTDSVAVTISGQGINMNGIGPVGSGLVVGTSGSLGASNHGGVTVHLVISDSSIALLAPNTTTAGSGSLDIPVANGNTGFSFVVQGLEGQTGAYTITASAPGFSNGTTPVNTVVQPAADIIFLSTSQTTFSPNNAFQVRIGIPNAQLTGMQQEQVLRFGGTSVTASLNSSAPNVGDLVTQAGSGPNGSVTIVAPGNSRSPGTVATGGIEFDPKIGGSTTVSAQIPGYVALPQDTVVVNVSSPGISIGAVSVGAGLQVGNSFSLGASNHGGTTVHVRSSDPGLVLISPNATTPGDTAIDVVIPNGQTTGSFVVQGVDSVTTTNTVAITATAPGFTIGSANATVMKSGFDVIFLTTNTTTFQPNNAFQVRLGIPNAGNTGLTQEQGLRAGRTPPTATVSNSNGTVGTLVFQGGPAPSGTVTFAPNGSRSLSPASAGGVEFSALAVGTTTVSATMAGFTPMPTATQTVTVTTPVVNLNAVTVGSGLQIQTGGNLTAGQHGGVTVQLSSNDPAILLAPDAVTPGQSTLNVVLTNGATSFSYFVQGLENSQTRGTVTAQVTGFVTGSASDSVATPSADIIFLPSSISATAATVNFQARLGVPDQLGNNISQEQSLRAGATALTVTIDNTNPSAAQLVTQAQGNTQSAATTVTAGTARTPSGLAAGGVQFDPLAQGVTAVKVTIPGFLVIPASTFTVNVGP